MSAEAAVSGGPNRFGPSSPASPPTSACACCLARSFSALALALASLFSLAASPPRSNRALASALRFSSSRLSPSSAAWIRRLRSAA